ncbi:MAG: hypothetical protein IH822_07875 [Chloroflexi bacterium]|nr:hypothetical protein [Chloroflexota bacterium]
MTKDITSFEWPAHTRACCTPRNAWVLVGEISWLVLHGEAHPRTLAWSIDHYLAAVRLAKVPR